MACCSRKKTSGKEPQSIKSESGPSSERIQPITPVKSANPKIEYIITIKTGNNRNSGTNGPVYIKIFGRDNKETDDILLTSASNEKIFQQDSIKKIPIQAIDIGKPQRIIIRHEDKTNGWFIDYVEISVHNFLIRFVANRWLDETKHDRKLSAELFGSEQPATSYDIEVQTGSEQIEPLDSPVYMQIFGTITNTPKFFLESKNASFTKDSKAKFTVSSNNVGDIQKIIIGHEGLGTVNDWYLKNVKVQTDTQQHEYTANKWLSLTKDDKKLYVELKQETPRASSPSPAAYLVTVHTAWVQPPEPIKNIQLTIRGSDGSIDKVLLKDYAKSNEQQLFQKGSSDQFEIKHKDIGKIENITIGFDDNDQKSAWLLESIDIQYEEALYHFQAQCWLSSRLGKNFNWITMKPDPSNDDIHYKVIIDTGESGINSNVILCIYGNENITKNFALKTTKDGTQAKFIKDSHLEFDLKGVDVGKIKKINIGHDGKGNEQQWFLKFIKIEKQNEHYTFKVNQCLSETQQNFIDLIPEELLPKKGKYKQDFMQQTKILLLIDQAIYKITVVTSSNDDSSTDSGVFMKIYGDKDQTKRFQLTTTKENSELLFKQGQTDEFEIELNDVGDINKINIGHDGKGLRPMWHVEKVQIQKGSQIFKFHADQVLDLSIQDIDLLPFVPEKSPSPKPTKSETPRSTSSEDKVNVKETIYKVSVQYGSLQKNSDDDDENTNLYLVIVGVNGKTKRMPLPVNKKDEIEFNTTDVGKISKILLGQDKNEHEIVYHVDNIIIKQENERTTFNIEDAIKQNTELEFTPSPIRQPSITRKSSISSETSTSDVKIKDVDYTIKVVTGDKAFNGIVNIKIRGVNGIITIPLSDTNSGAKPFQAKSSDEFTNRTTDVGKIKRITIECHDIEKRNTWHLKRIQILKGNQVYNFLANVRLDSKEPKIVLHPIDQRKEDYVQSELRRLRTNLRNESLKMHQPKHKAHEPFVYNNLSPYFDTSTVERAIYGPIEPPSGYYTRITALSIVEPWEAYGMDYGVNYELLRSRANRSQSAKRSASTQNGLMILPPLSLPYGGQITYVNSGKVPSSRSASSKTKHKSSLKHTGEQKQTTSTNA
ncbi:unnamed protein product [Adineta steineri]|uniref:PLAT domain-containing protein n=1 Tax=Adineta steineri TaxID=433720 RepID=A0A819F924_9BILA|nr:unnamed protein product [Adineta steineri]